MRKVESRSVVPRLLALLIVVAITPVAGLLHAGPPANIMIFVQEGDVRIDGDDRVLSAPAQFTSDSTKTIVLLDGARVALFNGSTRVVTGPAEIPLSTLGNPPPHRRAEAAAGGGLFDKRVERARAGASRLGGGLEIQRPVAGSIQSLTGREIRWNCEDCGPQDIALEDGTTGATLWSASGSSGHRYDGPELEANKSYILRVDGGSVALRTDVDSRDLQVALRIAATVESDLRSEGIEDRASLLQIKVVAYESAGFASEALYLLDNESTDQDPATRALLTALEDRLGLTP